MEEEVDLSDIKKEDKPVKKVKEIPPFFETDGSEGEGGFIQDPDYK